LHEQADKAAYIVETRACRKATQRALALYAGAHLRSHLSQGDFTDRVDRDDEFGAVGQALNLLEKCCAGIVANMRAAAPPGCPLLGR
jgi:methyl-accepting chemotaxis protein